MDCIEMVNAPQAKLNNFQVIFEKSLVVNTLYFFNWFNKCYKFTFWIINAKYIVTLLIIAANGQCRMSI